MTYKEYFNRNEDDIMSELSEEIDGLNMPKSIKDKMKYLIEDNVDDIVFDRYEKAQGDYEDDKYEQYKDDKIR